MSPLIFVAGGLVALLVARATSRTDPITHRAYGKRYANAPGADTENKPG